MIYGYARVSTIKQITGFSIEDQERQLQDSGCQEIVVEQCTGSRVADRPQLQDLIGRLQHGDTLICTKLDRLARNVAEGIELIKDLFGRGIKVNVLNIGIIEDTALGNFFLTTLLAVAELERSMIVERCQSGKEIAKTKAGFRDGRPPLPTERKNHAVDMIINGMTYKAVEAATGISKSTLVRSVANRRRENILAEQVVVSG